ncbi:MAG: serine/threonine protein kinase [Polyangiales bacterium]
MCGVFAFRRVGELSGSGLAYYKHMAVPSLTQEINRVFEMPQVGEHFGGRWLVQRKLSNRGLFQRFEAADEAGTHVEVEVLSNPAGDERTLAMQFLTQCRENIARTPVSILPATVYGRDELTGSVWAVRPMPGPSMSDAFEVHSLLNEGSTTLLLAGVHDATRRDVAIKILRRSFLGQKTAVERFRREARLAGDLKSSNIPACVARGVSDDGRPYFAIERFQGQSLVEALQEGPVSWDLARRVARGIGAALRVAHENDIVHRDVTPANVLLAGDAARDEDIKLLDFGIAAVCETREPKLSQIGRFVGTPAHCAPEQFYGFGIDAKADVYGLASTLYQALTAHLPYTTPIHELVQAKVGGPPPSPSSHRPSLSPAVDKWLLTPFKADPAKRPTLDRWLESMPER